VRQQSIRTLLNNFDTGDYNKESDKDLLRSCWDKWVCKDEELNEKTLILCEKLKELVFADNGKNIHLDKQSAIFSNRFSDRGVEYDRISIGELLAGKTIFHIIPKAHKTELWSIANRFEMPVVTGTWDNILHAFKTKKLNDRESLARFVS